MTVYEIFFIIFAAAFALEEYTASQEHGWDGESCHYHNKTTPEFATSPNLVYLANVCRFPNNGSALKLSV